VAQVVADRVPVQAARRAELDDLGVPQRLGGTPEEVEEQELDARELALCP
jgi:hypothetical protein